MPESDPHQMASEFLAAWETGAPIAQPPTSRDPAFDMNAAYRVEGEFARLRLAQGRTITGRKVGFANKAMWRVLKLETLVWAYMYDDTVHPAASSRVSLSLDPSCSPRLEPEIVFKLNRPLAKSGLDAAAVLEATEWLALGFEIVDCPFPGWQFKPADFVAAFGLHRALVVGQPLHVQPMLMPALLEELPRLRLKLFKGSELIEEGSGKNSLRSPALCVAELAGAILRQSGAVPLAAGELISTGTLTAAQPVAKGEVWRVEAEGLLFPSLTLTLT